MLRTYAAAFGLACGIALGATAVPALAGSYQVLYPFQGGSDGSQPLAKLIDVGGTFYGTTYEGGGTGCGGAGCGTVFSLNLMTGVETVIHSFRGANDGAFPPAGLIKVGALLYGTTQDGGNPGDGTVFSLNPQTGGEKILHRFQSAAGDGYEPTASLINVGGLLYGTTIYGGSSSCRCGTVFSVNPKTGSETVVYSFQGGSDGALPTSALIDVGGTLYGTTRQGGGFTNCAYTTYGCGTVFSVDPTTGSESVVYAFEGGSDGADPLSGGLLDVNGVLYGTTTEGGSMDCDCGTVFSLKPGTGVETVVYAFDGGADGGSPEASLIKVGAKLYGTSDTTVFSLALASGAEKVLHFFSGGDDGASPLAGLIGVGGTLYGTTLSGGSTNCNGDGCGTVFALTP